MFSVLPQKRKNI